MEDQRKGPLGFEAIISSEQEKGRIFWDPEYPEKSIEKVISPCTNLTAEQKRIILPKAVRVAREAFGTPMTDEDVENHAYEKTDIIYLIKERGELIGFSSFKEFDIGDKSVLYLDGTCILPKHQRKGLCSKITETQMQTRDYNYISMRTQSQVMYAAVRKLANIEEIYPNLPTLVEGKAPSDITGIALAIADKTNSKGMDTLTFVERGTYGRCLYKPLPEPRAQKLFDDFLKMDYHAGDSMIVVGKVNGAKNGR